MAYNFKAINILFFTICYINYNAQIDYFNNEPIWKLSSSCSAPYPCLLNSEYIYYIHHDTVINGLSYKSVFKKSFNTYLWMGPPPIQNCTGSYLENTFVAHIRNQGKNVFILSDTSEYLLYNFNLNVGDTLPLSYNNFYDNITISAIDSIFIDGEFLRKFELSGGSSSFLIEGIGHEFGFLEPFPPILECGFQLDCYQRNGLTYFPTLNHNCLYNVNLHEKQMSDFSINRGFNSIFITTNTNGVKELVVREISGKILMKSTFRGNNFELNLFRLDRGIYVISIDNISKKLIW